jgi:hypothetical protein
MDIIEATWAYEDWLAREIEVVAPDLECKHELMSSDAFTFFRATYYRWLQTVLDVAPDLAGPAVACAGDLHTENFGVWRNADGHPVWGVNDFDESESLPYALDLARLATSAALAIDKGELALDPAEAAGAVLRGYRTALDTGGGAFVLDGHHHDLAEMVSDSLPKAGKWWGKVDKLPLADQVPPGARLALEGSLPEPNWPCELRVRAAGVGSRGHHRFVALGELGDEQVGREIKEGAPPAGRWLGRAPTAGALDVPIIRSPDPCQYRRDGWLTRRFAPDCVKLDLGDLTEMRSEEKLFEWMGRKTANVHLGSAGELDAIRADLDARPDGWLHTAATALFEATQRDAGHWQEARAGQERV